MPRRQRHVRRRSSTSGDSGLMLALEHHLLDLRDRLRGVQVLRASLGAIHDRVAAVQAERIFELIETLAGRLVARVDDPTIGGEQGRGPEETIAVPPVARARSRTAGAQDAGRRTVDLFLVLLR